MFSTEFPSVATTASPGFVAAKSGRRDAPAHPADPSTHWLSGVRALRYARSGHEGEEWVVEEARTIAEFILGATTGRHCVPRTESDRDAGIPFECSARDFLIVTRERAHLSVYAAALQAALYALRSSLGPDHLSVRMTQLNLAFVELGFGDVAQALARMDDARPWFAAQPGAPSGQLLQAIDFRRATALTLLKRPAEALALLDGIDGGALAQASWGEDWPHRLQAERALALHGLGQLAPAQALMAQAVQGMQGKCSNQPACDGYASLLRRWQRAGNAVPR
jgi:hypothetical protein